MERRVGDRELDARRPRRACAAVLACACTAFCATAVAQTHDAPAPYRVRSRHDAVLSWMPRYRLDTTTSPLGLEQQMWMRIESLPVFHRATLDATGLADGRIALHFAGWGALDLFVDSAGGVAAGDVAIAYVEVDLAPVRLWAGRRFITFGPPGGMHVDAGGASVRTSFGLVAEAFVGRPVTPARTQLLGPTPSFDGAAIAYGARVGYADAGTLAVAASYAELWSHGIVGSRTVDVSAYWNPADLRLEAGAKIDVRDPGVAQARVGASYRFAPELVVDADYLHVEPGRWIPPWSILSVFDTSTFDEVSMGATWRPIRGLAIRPEGAVRVFSARNAQDDEPRVGYRADFTVRVAPTADRGPRVRLLGSRRDDGTMGYTLVTLGAAFDPFQHVVVAVDGAFAIDDEGRRESVLGRASVDWTPARTWMLGFTFSVARTPIVEAETRGMLRVRWSPEAP